MSANVIIHEQRWDIRRFCDDPAVIAEGIDVINDENTRRARVLRIDSLDAESAEAALD